MKSRFRFGNEVYCVQRMFSFTTSDCFLRSYFTVSGLSERDDVVEAIFNYRSLLDWGEGLGNNELGWWIS